MQSRQRAKFKISERFRFMTLADRTRTIDELNRRINQLFTEHNIEIAFNQLDIFIKNQSTDEEIKLSSEKLALAN